MVLRTFSPADMLYFDYNSDKMTATLKVPEGKVNAGSKAEVMILFGGSSGDVYYAPYLDIIDKSDNPLNVKGRIATIKIKVKYRAGVWHLFYIFSNRQIILP